MILVGDCVELMAAMPDASVDAVVTDPPYGLEFMGKEWDRLGGAGIASTHEDADPFALQRGGSLPFGGGGQRVSYGVPGRPMQDWHHRWATEALRVLKPGGHLLAFGGTRTYHRLGCAMEDAGFEIRDTLCWLYGSGFPKSLDVSKAIDKAAGVEREVVGIRQFADGTEARRTAGSSGTPESGEAGQALLTAPATPEAERWQGWGTALKPAHEPIVVARKPLGGTVAANVLEHGTGAINVDGCRVEAEGGSPAAARRQGSAAHCRPGEYGEAEGRMVNRSRPGRYQEERPGEELGRWPANVVLDEEAARLLDAQTGILTSGPESDKGHRRNADRAAQRNAYGGFRGQEAMGVLYGDSGGASRFFYIAKASRAERNAGLEGFARIETHRYGAGIGGSETSRHNGAPDRNHHPTVKPVALMRWLVHLVTPPGGLVLDPFSGSGTTGIACALEGFEFIGCEQDADYAKIAEARIVWWAEHGEEALAIVKAEEKAEAEREAVVESGQLDLLEGIA